MDRHLGAIALLALAAGFGCSEATAPAAPVLYRAISPGGFHTCALASDDRAYCWGANGFGQVGGGSNTPLVDQYQPAAVTGVVGFATLVAGGFHTCALDATGRAYCWGQNASGQLGTGTASGPQQCRSVACAATPTLVSDTLRFQALAAGWEHSCGLTPAGAVYCWGSNRGGELGTGQSEANSPTPVRVASPVGFVAVSAGARHTCALGPEGRAYCWGENWGAQLGAGASETCSLSDSTTVPCSRTPVPAATAQSFRAVSAGGGHTCALAADSTAYCWGLDDQGQLGVSPDSVQCQLPGGPAPCSMQPVAVTGGRRFVALAAGGAHTCGLTSEGQAFCWGSHLDGQVGDCSLRSQSPTPSLVCGGFRFSGLGAGAAHTCAVAADGAAYCWGRNDEGELGSGIFSAFGPLKVGAAR